MRMQDSIDGTMGGDASKGQVGTDSMGPVKTRQHIVNIHDIEHRVIPDQKSKT